MVAEVLRVDAYLVTYPQSMSEIELMKMDRSLIPTIDALDRERQQIAKQEMDSGKARKTAQGIATSRLYTTQGAVLMQSLLPCRTRIPIVEYEKWLVSL